MLGEQGQARSADVPQSFLNEVNSRLAQICETVFAAGSRLGEKGFYGPPEKVSNADAKAPQEANLRSEILGRLRDIESAAQNLNYQIERLA